MKKGKIVFWAVFCILLIFSANSANAQDVSLSHVQAAEKGLYAFLEIIPQIQQEDGEFGFSETDSLDQVSLGVPYNLHKIDASSLSDYAEGDTVFSLISETQMWYFPLILEDQMKAILIVDKVKDEWKAVGLGRANLSAKLEMVRKDWPVSKGYGPLLVSFQGKEYLYTVPEKNAYNLTSLTFQEEDKKRHLEKGDADFSDQKKLSNVVEGLSSYAKKSLEMEQVKAAVSGKLARSSRASTGPMGRASICSGNSQMVLECLFTGYN